MELCLGLVGSMECDESSFEIVEPSVSRKVFCKLYASIHTLAPMTNALIKKTQNQLAYFNFFNL